MVNGSYLIFLRPNRETSIDLTEHTLRAASFIFEALRSLNGPILARGLRGGGGPIGVRFCGRGDGGPDRVRLHGRGDGDRAFEV